MAAKLRPETLRFLVFFGSVSGRFGNRGQADYAAASEILNKLAHDLDRRWPSPAWFRSTGARGSRPAWCRPRCRRVRERGVVLIPLDVGCRMLDEELRNGRKGEAEVVIGGAEGLEGGPKDPVAVGVGSAWPLLGAAGRSRGERTGAWNRCGP